MTILGAWREHTLNQLRKPVCADCVAFRTEEIDGDGLAKGRCRLRLELGLVPENLPHCHVFQVRSDRMDQLIIPEKKIVTRQSTKQHSVAIRQMPAKATLKKPTSGDTNGEICMDRDGFKQVLREILEEETLYGYPEMTARWEDGTLSLKPSDSTMQQKDFPIETFFHKIVMLRDRLRVLEAKINAHSKLDEQEKVELQAYITKCYGSLTSFNVLFKNNVDHFKSK
jgi:hypothetical protein